MSPVSWVPAAGAVVWRAAMAGPEVALIHRPRYGDWSLPKGKLAGTETAPVAAAREVFEETGFRCRLGRYLGSSRYELGAGQNKHVDYWAAQAPAGDGFAPNDEADQLRWVAPAATAQLLSYPGDQAIVDEFSRKPAATHTLIVVRHAKAGHAGDYRGDDRLRPLEPKGVAQAGALVPNLLAFGASAVFSADRVRCTQTVQQLAAHLRVAIRVEHVFGENAFAVNPAAAVARLREIERQSADSGDVAVIASQGNVIPALISAIAASDGVQLPASRNRKASMWILSFTGGKLLAADYLDSPLPAAIA